MKEDNQIIYEAVKSHSQFSPNQREVLCILLSLQLEGEVVANINDIKKLSNSTRSTISTAISFFNKHGVITNTNVNGKKFTGCLINQEKISEIVAHYKKKKNLIKK
jgi:hypothetical protein